jgi:hypothetical protein
MDRDSKERTVVTNPHKPGTPEWQQWLNDQIAEHDKENKARDAKINAELAEQARKAAEESE